MHVCDMCVYVCVCVCVCLLYAFELETFIPLTFFLLLFLPQQSDREVTYLEASRFAQENGMRAEPLKSLISWH